MIQILSPSSALNEKGIAAARLGNLAGARKLFEETIVAAPDYAPAYNNLGNVLRRLGELELAERSIRHAICLDPTEPDYHLNLAHLLRRLGRQIEALASARLAFRFGPDRMDARRLVAELLDVLGEAAEAVKAYQELLALAPEDAVAHNDLGNLFQRLGRPDQAEACYERAAQADPRLVAPNSNRARILADRGEVEAARQLFQVSAAVNASPQLKIAAATVLPVIYESVEHVRATRERLTADLAQLKADGVRLDPTVQVLPNLFYLAYQGGNDRDLMAALGELLLSPGQRALQLPTPQPNRGGRVRLGILSRYLHDHTVGRLNLGWVERLPRASFELFLLPVGSANDDAIARRYRAAVDKVVPIGHDLSAALVTVAGCRLDLLFFPDLGMDPFTFTLAASRLAAVQAVTWGHPSTTGLPTVDVFMTCQSEIPEANQHYTERLVRLPRLGVFLDRPKLEGAANRTQIGLPNDAHIYGCLQSLFKFHPDFDVVLGGVLRADPRGMLVLLEGHHPTWTERLKERLARTLGDVLDRVRWLPRVDRRNFQHLVACCDVLLDTFPFGGGHSTYEAFAAGVPVVSMPTPYLRGRLTLAMLEQMKLSELAATTAEKYVTCAVHLATDAGYHSEIRDRIAQRAAEIFEDDIAVMALTESLLSLTAK